MNMPLLDILFLGALFCAAFSAGFGSRAAVALVCANIATSAYGLIWDYSPLIWLVVDVLTICAIIIPGLIRWGGVTQKNMVICALFVVSWRFYFLDASDYEQYTQLAKITTAVATLQLLLSMPWARMYHHARVKLKHEDMPPDSYFDERRVHGAGR